MRNSLFSSLLVAGAFLHAVVMAERKGLFGCPSPTQDDTINKDDPITPLQSLMPLRVYLKDGPPEEAGQFNTVTLNFVADGWTIDYFNSTTKAAPISTKMELKADGTLPSAIIMKGLPRFLMGADQDGDLTLTPISSVGSDMVIFEACSDKGLFLKHKIYRYLAVGPSVNTTALDWRCVADAFNNMYGINSIPGGVEPVVS